jgi:hypothetical protein
MHSNFTPVNFIKVILPTARLFQKLKLGTTTGFYPVWKDILADLFVTVAKMKDVNSDEEVMNVAINSSCYAVEKLLETSPSFSALDFEAIENIRESYMVLILLWISEIKRLYLLYFQCIPDVIESDDGLAWFGGDIVLTIEINKDLKWRNLKCQTNRLEF